jgi:hypothetical protein
MDTSYRAIRPQAGVRAPATGVPARMLTALALVGSVWPQAGAQAEAEVQA